MSRNMFKTSATCRITYLGKGSLEVVVYWCNVPNVVKEASKARFIIYVKAISSATKCHLWK